MVAHCPYRNWCRHCVAGKGKADSHRSDPDAAEDRQVPSIHIDYAFLGEKESCEVMDRGTLPYAVVKDGPPPSGTRWVDSHVVQSKGVQHPYSARIVAQDIINAGYGDFLFKSDGEPAIVALKKAAVGEVRRLGHSVIAKPEESPVRGQQQEWIH